MREGERHTIRPGCAVDDAGVGVDGFQELTDDQRNGLDALDFLLSASELGLQVDGLVLDVFGLDL